MTKDNPLVSVIVPAYNTAKHLPKCLNSIIKQSYQNLEIIIIDDGSTDNSSTIIERFAKNDKRIKAIQQKNQGLSEARNNGVKKATGKYITFVDSDDQIAKTMIEKMVQAIIKTKANIAVCSFKEIYPNGKTAHFNRQKNPQKIYDTKNALKAMLQEQGFMVSSTMKLFPIDYFKDIKFPKGMLHEDVNTTYKLIMKAERIIFIPDELYYYVHHDNSIITQEFDERKLILIKFTDQMCDDIEKKFPTLKDITNERRIRARFSILRQIPLRHHKTKQIINYLKTHQNYIINNPNATAIDRAALKLILISPKLFQLSYKLFKRHLI